jgi:hypothetical protein
MPTIHDLKELETPQTPLFLFDCTLASGDVYRWSTHKVTVNGANYAARVLKHNLFELRSSSDDSTDGVSKATLTLANADSFLSPVARTVGWKGAQLTSRLLFFDLENGTAASDSQVLFRGTANPPDESTETYLRLSFTNRLSLQRIFLPEVRIQKRCPWAFPSTPAQMGDAISGGARGRFSPLYKCGYSAGSPQGVGNLSSGAAFNSCDYTRSQCQERGMFDKDSAGNVTQRFGGIEFVPASILVRGYGDKSSHVSTTLDNQARYNDFVPLIYGTGWYLPPIVFARNDGNLTHTEVLLGSGEMSDVVKVIVNSVEIPAGVAGANMTATGWYNVVTLGARNGNFNADFKDSTGKTVGDPYGSMACLSVVVPNRISDGRALPEIAVLVQGLKLDRFDASGSITDTAFTNNPAWVLLDVLRRSGWTLADVDLASFAAVAQRCDQPISALDLHGNATLIPRYQCNLLLTQKRSAADIVRGIRNAASLFVGFSTTGLLQLRTEDTLAVQQSTKPDGSNSTDPLNDGWPAYEFGDNEFSGIIRRSNGQSSFRTWTRPSSDSPNLFTVEFQDEFNEYQQDSLSLVDLDDSLLASQQVGAPLAALGIPNFNQATRVTSLQLNKSIHGNTYVDLETSVRGAQLRPGDLIAITYTREGWDRQPFRIVRLAPSTNFRTAAITAQIHDDAWYETDGAGGSGSGRQPGFEVGLPRPLLGTIIDAEGNAQFDISETTVSTTDGTTSVQLTAGFVTPNKALAPGSGIPLVGLNAQIATTGGTLPGGLNYYYGVSGSDTTGAESGLSFLVKAQISAGTQTNAVTLPTLSFPPSAATFNVYRGTTPAQLLQIATSLPLAAQFLDSGATPSLVAPPDVNYDHANFYWRIELQPEEIAGLHSPLTVGNTTLQMLPNELSGALVRITKGLGAAQERKVLGNTSTIVTIDTPWQIEPDVTSWFAVSESSWQFGATGATSPVSFEVPNREGTTLQVSGRSANVRNQESAYELSPLTRWQIIGGGSLLDTDVPPAPVFGISAIGQGTIDIPGVSALGSLVNTRTINAGTLTVWYWDELSFPTLLTLAADLDAAAAGLTFNTPVSFAGGEHIQIGTEVMIVASPVTNTTLVGVTRGTFAPAVTSLVNGTSIYLLNSKIFVLPFARDFFGSLASGSYSYPVYIPDVRVAAAELFFTNSHGNGDVTRRAFTVGASAGIRTLSGGQLSIQLEGMLAIQTDAAPPLTIDATHSVNDVFATVGTAPTGLPVILELTQQQDGATVAVSYCTLTIPAGSTTSNTVDGLTLAPLLEKALIRLNILSVSHGSDTLPGSDLTVTIRL